MVLHPFLSCSVLNVLMNFCLFSIFTRKSNFLTWTACFSWLTWTLVAPFVRRRYLISFVGGPDEEPLHLFTLPHTVTSPSSPCHILATRILCYLYDTLVEETRPYHPHLCLHSQPKFSLPFLILHFLHIPSPHCYPYISFIPLDICTHHVIISLTFVYIAKHSV